MNWHLRQDFKIFLDNLYSCILRLNFKRFSNNVIFHTYHMKFCWELILSENDGNCKHGNEQLTIDFVYMLYTLLQHLKIFLMEMNPRYAHKAGKFLHQLRNDRRTFHGCSELSPLRNLEFILHIWSFKNSKLRGQKFWLKRWSSWGVFWTSHFASRLGNWLRGCCPLCLSSVHPRKKSGTVFPIKPRLPPSTEFPIHYRPVITQHTVRDADNAMKNYKHTFRLDYSRHIHSCGRKH
jgi:hypothetical protein